MTSPKPQASREVLEALAEAVDAAARACDMPEGTPPELFQRTWLARCEALAAYRAEIAPPLRTRAEVDAEIASIIRACERDGERAPDDLRRERWCRVRDICAERTRETEP